MKETQSASSVVAKFAVTIFSVLAAVTAVWTGYNMWRHAKARQAAEIDERLVKSMFEIVPKVKVLAEMGYDEEQRKLERQTGQWSTFFHTNAQIAGLTSNQYRLPAKQTVAGRGYEEHRFEIRLNAKSGVTRTKLVNFLWSLENRRTYLKVRAINLKRQGEEEDWGGATTIAYREKR